MLIVLCNPILLKQGMYVYKIQNSICTNLIDGIPESPRESDTDCHNKVVDIFIQNMTIEHVHDFRISVGNNSKPRGIIVKFHWYGDRTQVWSARRQLKGSNLWINENFPTLADYQKRLTTSGKGSKGEKVENSIVHGQSCD